MNKLQCQSNQQTYSLRRALWPMPKDPGAYCRFSEGRIPQGDVIFGTTTPSVTIIRMNYKFNTA